jgi:hypothetical protein
MDSPFDEIYERGILFNPVEDNVGMLINAEHRTIDKFNSCPAVRMCSDKIAYANRIAEIRLNPFCISRFLYLHTALHRYHLGYPILACVCISGMIRLKNADETKQDENANDSLLHTHSPFF